jgi:cytochrome c oxidase assembly protein subunit 17
LETPTFLLNMSAETRSIIPQVATIASSVEVPAEHAESKPLKPCCACPETKKVRDECITLHGEDSCAVFIEQHKECLRSHGFNVK